MRKTIYNLAFVVAIGLTPTMAHAGSGDRLYFIFYGEAKVTHEENRKSGAKTVSRCKNARAKGKTPCFQKRPSTVKKKALRIQK